MTTGGINFKVACLYLVYTLCSLASDLDSTCHTGDMDCVDDRYDPVVELVGEVTDELGLLANAEGLRGVPLFEKITAALTNSATFREQIWQQRPFMLRMHPELLGKATFGWKDAISLTDKGLLHNVNNGFMLESVKDGISRTFRFGLDKKGKLTRKQVEELSRKSSWLIGSAHTIVESVADLTRVFQDSFGLPASCNIYVTRANFETAAPLHTDRMDSFVLQTSGTKRWKIYSPTIELPVWGVHGDGQWAKGGGQFLRETDVGAIVFDGVLYPGDLLYLPRGFPHQTSTIDTGAESIQTLHDSSSASIAYTIAVSTEAWHLVYEKVLRCAFSVAGLCADKPPVACPAGVLLTEYARTHEGRLLRESLPLGFMSGNMTSAKEVAEKVAEQLTPHVDHLLKTAAETGVGPKTFSVSQVDSAIKKIVKTMHTSLSSHLATLSREFHGANLKIPFSDRQQSWGAAFAQNSPFDAKVCHPAGGRALFADYRTAKDDELTHTVKTTASLKMTN